MNPQPIEPGERIPVRFTLAQRDTILEHMLIGSDLEMRFRDAVAKGRSIVVGLTFVQLEDLLGCVAAEANHSKDASACEVLDELYEDLEDVEDEYKRRRAAARPSP